MSELSQSLNVEENESDAVYTALNGLQDQLNEYSRLLFLVLAALRVDRVKMDDKKTFSELFSVLTEEVGELKTAVSITCHVLSTFGFNHTAFITSLKQYASEDFDITNYQTVDFRLTVTSFFYRLRTEDNKRHRVLKYIADSYLQGIPLDGDTIGGSVVEFVIVLHDSGMIKTDNISVLQRIAEHYEQPTYFTEYCQRYPSSIVAVHIILIFICITEPVVTNAPPMPRAMPFYVHVETPLNLSSQESDGHRTGYMLATGDNDDESRLLPRAGNQGHSNSLPVDAFSTGVLLIHLILYILFIDIIILTDKVTFVQGKLHCVYFTLNIFCGHTC